jgi:phosphatidate cytidylyltransferase
MFRQRVASALVGMPVVLAVTWRGGLPFMLLVGLFGAAALREFYLLSGVDHRPLRALGYTGHFILFILAWFFGLGAYTIGFVGFFLFVNLYWLVTYPQNFHRLSSLIWGKTYITTLLVFLLFLRMADNGFLLVLALLLAVWASDSGAYIVGMTLGRRRLLPAVSPKKSVEGALGGLAFAAIILFLAGPWLELPRVTALFFGMIISAVGQLGDLAESALKRWGNIKDSGTFLPGHGGVLDRLDSVLFAAPVAYLFYYLLIWQVWR